MTGKGIRTARIIPWRAIADGDNDANSDANRAGKPDDGAEHGAAAPVHARSFARDFGAGRRNRAEGRAGDRLSAHRNREKFRETDVFAMHSTDGPHGLPCESVEQDRKSVV